MQLLVTLRTAGWTRQLLITADPAVSLREALGDDSLPDRIYIGNQPVSIDATLDRARLSDGAIVSDRPIGPEVPVASAGTPALLVAAGPSAGASITLPPSEIVVGREAPLDLADESVSRHHLSVRVDDNTAGLIRHAKPGNRTLVSAELVPSSTPAVPGKLRMVPEDRFIRMPFGEIIWVGKSMLTLATAPEADAALAPWDNGRRLFSRSPRQQLPAVMRPSGKAPTQPEPAKPSFSPTVFISAAAPVVFGLVSVFVFHDWAYVAFALLSPVIAVANYLYQRRRVARENLAREENYRRELAAHEAEQAGAVTAEVNFRRQQHPEPAALLLRAVAPSRRLWERQPGHPDFLDLRVGVGTIGWPDASLAGVVRSAADSGIELPYVPVSFCLPACGAVGLAGESADPRVPRGLARSMLLSLAVLHSPRDVTITLLTSSGAADGPDWDWLRFLPHARKPDGSDSVARVGNDRTSIDLRLTELRTIIDAESTRTARRPDQARSGNAHVVVLDGVNQLRLDYKGIDVLLDEGPGAGIYCLCLDEVVGKLPHHCGQNLQLSDEDGIATISGLHPATGRPVYADAVSAAVCERAARAMAPLRDSSERGHEYELPVSLRYLDLANLEPPTPDSITASWQSSGRSARALIGRELTGPFELDLRDSPHVLIAGMTGAGKSELLRTFIVSLATVNRPDALNFALIDYKGGAAFTQCQPLPHSVGLLTDLIKDQSLVDRAIDSLRVEMRRRMTVLEQAGHEQVESYWAALPGKPPGTDPLPRLMVVIDEFAAMIANLPDQQRAVIVDLGRRGRSLGIHLVLADQNPIRVDRQLRSNIDHNIALRVNSPEISKDIIDSGDASSIPIRSRGRAFARSGEGRAIAFQTAHLSAVRPGIHRSGPTTFVAEIGWPDLGRPLPPEPVPDGQSSEPTDLSVLVAAIAEAGRRGSFPRQRSPWLPQLAASVSLGQLDGLIDPRTPGRAAGPSCLPFAMADITEAQVQIPDVFDLARGQNLLVAGGEGSGRSTLLRTLAMSMCARLSGDDAHLYVVDCAGNLAGLARLPQCGAFVAPQEPERVGRLLTKLIAEIRRRKTLLTDHGYGSLARYRELRSGEAKLPYLLLLVNRYDSYVDNLGSVDDRRLIVSLNQVIKEGPPVGVQVVVAGGPALLNGSLGIEDQIALRIPAETAHYLPLAVRRLAASTTGPAGRGVRVREQHRIQVATLSGSGQADAENEVVRARAAELAMTGLRIKPFRVDRLPGEISYRQTLELPDAGTGIFVGVGGDELSRVHVDTSSLLVIGRDGTGRSSALAVQGRSLAGNGRRLIAITPRPSRLPRALGATAFLHLRGTDSADLEKLAAELDEPGPVAVLVDDAEFLDGTDVGKELINRCQHGRDLDQIVVAATTMHAACHQRGLVGEVAKSQCGLVLEPATYADAQPILPRLPASAFTADQPQRAVLVRRQAIQAVQIPAVTEEAG